LDVNLDPPGSPVELLDALIHASPGIDDHTDQQADDADKKTSPPIAEQIVPRSDLLHTLQEQGRGLSWVERVHV